MADQEAILNALFASGFPFQTAIATLIERVLDCRIEQQEFPWRDDLGVDHFLDVVVSKHQFIFAIECKKTQKEIFTFLQPMANGSAQGDEIRCRCLHRVQIRDSSLRWELACSEWNMRPKSAESGFCVVSTSASGRDQRLLERDAQLVIGGADAFGSVLKRQATAPIGAPDQVVIPVIVTNAKLFKAQYDPEIVSLDTGQLRDMPAEGISSIQWIRFRKAFTARNPDCGDRTVFIVAAKSLSDFLGLFDYIGGPSTTSWW